jgi:predicted nucleotidyltransferase component of viral defense system
LPGKNHDQPLPEGTSSIIMKKKEIKNLSASVRARLYNIAKQTGREFDALVLQYFQERFLYRISISDFRENFILKGALLLLSRNITRFRPTKDIDLLGKKIDGSLENIKKTMEQLSMIHCDDGVIFNNKRITVELIRKGANYEGVRVKIEANLGVMRRRIQIDIGFSGIIVPAPVETEFPVILDFPHPRIKSYTFESAIGEKFEAIVKMDYQTSRMKDFYDIYFIASKIPFELKTLKKALICTFADRGTDIMKMRIIFDEKFKQNSMKLEQWQAFLRKNELDFTGDFGIIVEKIKLFIMPILDSSLEENKNYNWNFKNWKWLEVGK